jgi:DNA-binding response OmpR family regulator
MAPPTPLSILFADRDLAATRPLRVELRRRGAGVALVDSAAEAMERTLEAAPELLILDEGLSQDGGVDLVSTFHRRRPKTELILLHSGGDGVPHGAGQGLLFSARKPVSKEILLEVIVSAFPGRLGEDPIPLPRTHTLLCVDDDPAYLKSLSRFLERRGYRVCSHEDPLAALKSLAQIRPDLAIVDIKMPEMDGLSLARRIREDFKGEVPVVVLTALDSKETYHQARESGASYCLTKPCKPEDFLNVVDFIAGDLDEEERRLLRSRVMNSGGV